MSLSANPAVPYNHRLHLFGRLVAALAFLLIIAGALVTSNDAGLAVPDWPTSFGSLYQIPPMVGGIKFEHGHRMLAEMVGLLTLIGTIWALTINRLRFEIIAVVAVFGVFLGSTISKNPVALVASCVLSGVVTIALAVRPNRPVYVRTALLIYGAVNVQGALGGLTVLNYLPWQISSAHAALGQTFFAGCVLFALHTSRSWSEGATVQVADEGTPSLYTLSLLTLAVLYLQLFFGAAFRHHGMSIMEHLFNAVVVTAVIVTTAMRVGSKFSESRAIRIPGKSLMHLLFLQLLLGGAAYMTRIVWGRDAVQPLPSMVASTVAHVAMGALMLAFAFVLEEQVRRNRGFELATAPQATSQKVVSA